MPRLLTIKTDLSEYKAPQYGYDRRGAGPRNTNASGQPYEITNLPKRSFTISDYGRTSEKPDEDFLLRGGQLPQCGSRARWSSGDPEELEDDV